MSKYDIYLYDNSTVLKNKLNITDEKQLDQAEADLAKANMMLLYESGFPDFSPAGFCEIHRKLFGDIYDWAGQYRIINIRKRQSILAGNSVWYSDCDDIENDLVAAWKKIHEICWSDLSREEFIRLLVVHFSSLWHIHPFREGNTRTTVMMIALFVEYYGYYFDYDLMEASAGYVRNALVLCCFDEHSEYEHLEKILLDAVSSEPFDSSSSSLSILQKAEKYKKYYTEDYKPVPHEYVDDEKAYNNKELNI